MITMATPQSWPASSCRPVSLALVTETYAPEVNGVAMTLGRLVEGLRQRGHRVQVVRPRQAGDGKRAPGTHLRPGIPIPGYPELRFGLPSRSTLRAAWRANPPGVVHIATEGPMGLSAMGAAADCGIPVTTTFHTNFHQYSNHYAFGFLSRLVAGYLRRFHNRSACTLVPTRTARTALEDIGVNRVDILSRGVDTTLFDPAKRDRALRRCWGADDDTLVLLCVGRLAPEKNLDLAIEALHAVRAVRPDTRLVLVGDGPDRDRLASTEGLILAGMRHGEDLARHYASADCFCFPSLTETFGNVLTEALASGLPAVAFDYAAASERLSDGCEGHSAPFGDRTAFIDACVRLASASSETRTAMAEAARATAAGWSWGRIVDRFEQVLLTVCDDHPVAVRHHEGMS